MTAGDLKIASLAFAGLTATVALNLMFLQDKRVVAGIETSALGQRAAGQNANSLQSSDAAPLLVSGAAPARMTPTADATTNAAEIVRGIQRELDARGYEAGQPDGVAGLVTRAAIMAYEHDYGLGLTATPSQELLSRIVLGSSAPPAQRGAADKIAAGEAESVALMVEQQLAALGYTPGKADGKLDEHTSRAIREFEIDQKLAESGRISGPLVSRLLRLQGSAGKVAAPVKVPVVAVPVAKAQAAAPVKQSAAGAAKTKVGQR
jgi:peptidoglycan hydrolase-like protein with peptidoglycan-binding domain